MIVEAEQLDHHCLGESVMNVIFLSEHSPATEIHTSNGVLIFAGKYTGLRSWYTCGISCFVPPRSFNMYRSSNLCVSSTNDSRSATPKWLAPHAKNFFLLATEESNEMDARTVNPPALPPRIAVRSVSMSEESSGDWTAPMQSLTSVMPQFPLRRSLATTQ